MTVEEKIEEIIISNSIPTYDYLNNFCGERIIDVEDIGLVVKELIEMFDIKFKEND